LVNRFRVRARIYTINGFSAHADQAELLARQKQTGAKRTFLVHGEEDTMRSFATYLGNTRVELPEPNQAFELQTEFRCHREIAKWTTRCVRSWLAFTFVLAELRDR
jgi:predicted metal-dependent RNase